MARRARRTAACPRSAPPIPVLDEARAWHWRPAVVADAWPARRGGRVASLLERARRAASARSRHSAAARWASASDDRLVAAAVRQAASRSVACLSSCSMPGPRRPSGPGSGWSSGAISRTVGSRRRPSVVGRSDSAGREPCLLARCRSLASSHHHHGSVLPRFRREVEVTIPCRFVPPAGGSSAPQCVIGTLVGKARASR